ncbi:MAG: rhamnulokinase family protein [Candidatus Bathyarchaeia archaeon]
MLLYNDKLLEDMGGPVFLAIDLGASGGKAIVGILEDERLVVEEVDRFPNYMVKLHGSLYWDVLYLWQRIKDCLKIASKKYRSELVSVGIDTWGVDFALLDSRGELIGNPHTYRDPRTEGVMDEVLERIPRRRIYERTGIQFMRINTLYQLYSMVRNSSPQLKIASTLLMIPDLFNYWLTGVKVAEYTEASTTQFLDPRRKEWCIDILEDLGIPTYILPSIVEPATRLGPLLDSISEDIGVDGIEVVAPATHDTASAIAAAPLVDRETGYVSSGTWSLVGVELNEPLINDDALNYNFTNEGGAFGTITFLRNVQGMWILEEVRRNLAERGYTYGYEELIDMAYRVEQPKAFIDPDDPRFLAPGNMIKEINDFIDETEQEKPSSIGELVRVILESLALKYRLVFDQASHLIGRRLNRINIFGGGSRNWLLDQLTADYTGIPVYAGPEEATSIGNILIQAAGLGYVDSLKDLRRIVRDSFHIREYTPNTSSRHEESYQRFLEIISKNIYSDDT